MYICILYFFIFLLIYFFPFFAQKYNCLVSLYLLSYRMCSEQCYQMYFVCFTLVSLYPTAPSIVPIMHQISSTMNSFTLSWPQPEQPNGIILDYELRFYEKVSSHCIKIKCTSNKHVFSDMGL